LQYHFGYVDDDTQITLTYQVALVFGSITTPLAGLGFFIVFVAVSPPARQALIQLLSCKRSLARGGNNGDDVSDTTSATGGGFNRPTSVDGEYTMNAPFSAFDYERRDSSVGRISGSPRDRTSTGGMSSDYEMMDEDELSTEIDRLASRHNSIS
jgi:hypothetical protein